MPDANNISTVTRKDIDIIELALKLSKPSLDKVFTCGQCEKEFSDFNDRVQHYICRTIKEKRSEYKKKHWNVAYVMNLSSIQNYGVNIIMNTILITTQWAGENKEMAMYRWITIILSVCLFAKLEAEINIRVRIIVQYFLPDTKHLTINNRVKCFIL